MLVNSFSKVSQQSVGLLLSLATIFEFQIWSEYLMKTYLQSAERILRKVYIRGKPELQLYSDEILDILRPLYCLADSGGYRHSTLLHHIKQDLEITATASDLSLHFNQIQGELQGIVATNVEGTVGTGTVEFGKETIKTNY